MDCPSLPTTAFFIVAPQREARFRLSEDEWNCIRPSIGQPRKLQPSWTNVMARHMAESNAYCTFHFHRHFMQKPNSRKRQYVNVFTAEGFCIFDDCDCKFNLVMKKQDLEKNFLTVTYSGSIKHAAGQRHSRFIKGNVLTNHPEGPDKPSMVYQAKKAELSGDAMASGNRMGCRVQQLCKKSQVKVDSYRKWMMT